MWQKMRAESLQGFRSEFEMTCQAQDGNNFAWMALWKHYKGLMLYKLRFAKGFSEEELISEALEVFSYKLSKFDRTKVSSEKAFSMHSWLYLSTINRTAKLIRRRKKEVHLYFEKVNANSGGDQDDLNFVFSKEDPTEDINPLQNQMLGINDELYATYDTEKLAIRELQESDTDRIKAFYAKLSPLERDILEARREGLTLAKTANKFNCSVTTVKNHIAKAKQYANDIFQVCYA